jgi:hypothetical protein
MYYHWGGRKAMGFFAALSERAASPIAARSVEWLGIGGDFYP